MICLLLLVSFVSWGKSLEEEYANVMAVYHNKSTEEAKNKALEFLAIAKGENDIYYITNTYFLLGYLFSESDDFGNSIIYYLEGARFAEKTDNSQVQSVLISIYKNLGTILGNYRHFELAHKFINRGLVIASETDNNQQIVNLLNNRVHEFLEERRYEDALHQLDSMKTIPEIEDVTKIKLHNKAGIAYKYLNQPELALREYNYVLENGLEKAPEIYAMSLENIGVIYLDYQEFEKAQDYFERQLEVSNKKGFQQLSFQANYMLGSTYQAKNNYSLAAHYFHEASVLDEENSLKPDNYSVYNKLSEVYTKLNNIDEAFRYKNLYVERLEEFIAEQKRIEELDKKYNIQLLTERYFDLLAANEKQQDTENIAKITLTSLVIIFLLIIFSIYYKQYRVKRDIQEEIRKIELMDI